MAINSNFTKLSSLSVFFPCFNEQENVVLMVNKALAIIPSLARKYEIIIVNDGSLDRTKQIAQKLAVQYPQVKVVNHKKNLGYGASLRTGFKSSQYQWVFFTDGDGQFDLTELKKFIIYADKYQVILGYRKNRVEGWKRLLFARLYKLYIDILFRVHVKDIDCAFKLIKTELISDLNLFSNGAFISAEMLYKLKKKQIKFKQIPVQHYARVYGKATGANLKVIMIGLWEPLKLYLKLKFNFKL